MADATDNTKELAAQFLELWQQQLSAMMKDPEISRSMNENLRMMQQSTLAWMHRYAPQQPATGAAVPGDSNPAIPDLQRRLAECEARIAALEQQLKG